MSIQVSGKSKVSMIALFGAFVLMPSLSQAAQPDFRDVVHDKRGNVVVNGWGNCVRTKWVGSGDECGPQVVVQQQTVRKVLTQDERTIYFPFDKATLTPESQARLDTLAGKIKDDQNVKEARIFGFADRIGSTTYNDKLSQRRAKAVEDYLKSRGVINTRVTETRWFGESQPATQCGEQPRAQLIDCLQKDRRVEIEVDYVPTAPQNQVK